MEQRNAAIRKKRVRAQQNLVTALCLVCMVFTVGWSAYAAVLEKNKPAAEPVKEKTAPVQEEQWENDIAARIAKRVQKVKEQKAASAEDILRELDSTEKPDVPEEVPFYSLG